MEKIPPVASYPDSLDSSPRSRGGESCDDLLPSSSSSSSRLRLMCSYGGRIVPRPTDKALCYLGGDTRMVVVDRHSSLGDFRAKLSRSLLNSRPFSLKYQLPNEDLDSLISVTTDEDFENLIDEYDRIVAGNAASGGGSTKSSRLRLFLFPSSSSASSSVGSLLDDETKSETWFVDALNSAVVSAGSGSINSLLGLDDDASLSSRPTAGPAAAAGSAAAQPIPDSPLLDKTSSFGSTSSAPSLSNLPPIPLPDPKPSSFDPAVSDPSGRSMYYPEKSSSTGEAKQDPPISAGFDGGYRIPVPVPDGGYMYPPMPQPQYIQQTAPAPATNNAFMPTLPTYYPIQPPPPQQQQQQHQQHQVIFVPYNLPSSSPHFPHPNAGKPFPRLPLDPEVQAANMYRTVPSSLAPPPAQYQQASAPPPYQIPGYHLVHQRPSQPQTTAGQYTYEFAEHGRAPMYYSQAPAPPSNSEAGQGDGKQSRPS